MFDFRFGLDGLIFFSAICYIDNQGSSNSVYRLSCFGQFGLFGFWFSFLGLVFSQLYTYLSHFKSESYHVKSKVRLLNEYITTNYCFGTFGLVQFGFLLDNLFDCLVGLFFSHSCRYPTHFKSDLYSLRNKVGLLK